jgi:predicted nucleic acid-binding protein
MEKLYEGRYVMFVTNEILLEYEEKISQNFDPDTAELNIGAMLLLPNLTKIDTYYRLKLIFPDLDDNKFADCSFAANAHYLVTNDRDFRILKSLPFPRFNVVRIEEFLEVVNKL